MAPEVVKTYQPKVLIIKKGNFYIIIGDVHKFIVDCLVPLEPYYMRQVLYAILKST